MDKINHIPDTPFRSSISGKYKLKVKCVIPKYSSYDYVLIDADWKEYKTEHKKHYAEGDLLRCMVNFKVENAKLAVEETSICSKQDFASPLPDAFLPKPQIIEAPKDKKPLKNAQLGDPYSQRISGKYRLQVVSVEKINKSYSIVLMDAQGRKYNAESTGILPVGSLATCKVQFKLVRDGALAVITHVFNTVNPNKPKAGKRLSAKRKERRNILIILVTRKEIGCQLLLQGHIFI